MLLALQTCTNIIAHSLLVTGNKKTTLTVGLKVTENRPFSSGPEALVGFLGCLEFGTKAQPREFNSKLVKLCLTELKSSCYPLFIHVVTCK